MEVLLLSPHEHLIEKIDGNIVQTTDKIDIFSLEKFDWIISYDYKHIITKDQLKAIKGKAINCHISYLPWNRGADPNLWSFIDDTPKGITIHYIDEGLDTGDIIYQKQVEFGGEHTLESTYRQLHHLMDASLISLFPIISMNNIIGKKQEGKGTYHKASDKNGIVLPNGWETNINYFRSVK